VSGRERCFSDPTHTDLGQQVAKYKRGQKEVSVKRFGQMDLMGRSTAMSALFAEVHLAAPISSETLMPEGLPSLFSTLVGS
jgi:hypothetical protein